VWQLEGESEPEGLWVGLGERLQLAVPVAPPHPETDCVAEVEMERVRPSPAILALGDAVGQALESALRLPPPLPAPPLAALAVAHRLPVSEGVRERLPELLREVVTVAEAEGLGEPLVH